MTLTAGVQLGLLRRGVVEEGARLEEVQVLVAVVGQDGLDHRVAVHLDLDIERAAGLAHAQRAWDGQGHRGEGKDTKELHGQSKEVDYLYRDIYKRSQLEKEKERKDLQFQNCMSWQQDIVLYISRSGQQHSTEEPPR